MTDTIETTRLSPAEMVADEILTSLDNLLGQGVLFEEDTISADIRRALERENPGLLVLEQGIICELRYQAAVLGAGFQLDDDLGKHNKMWDEVAHDNTFTHVVDEVRYDTSGFYICSRDQLREVLAFDYENLRGLAASGDFELIYGGDD